MAVTPGRAEQRFPGYDVTAASDTWDPVTRRVVLGRLGAAGPLRFFTAEEAVTARALLDRLVAQDHEPWVSLLEPIDRRLADRAGDGYRYADMPEDPEAWRESLVALDDEARARHDLSFAELASNQQMQVIESIRTADGEWRGLPAKRVFSLWIRYACTAFYSHPWAWNEIGFGGPAYPRGYANLGIDRREHWEVAERDAADPIPWIKRRESARGRHIDAMAADPTSPGPQHDGPDPASRS
ncbi:MAG: gluconate 2-dehydrogenase subunit 3 family protein [Acidimicrobiales bacterium]